MNILIPEGFHQYQDAMIVSIGTPEEFHLHIQMEPLRGTDNEYARIASIGEIAPRYA